MGVRGREGRGVSTNGEKEKEKEKEKERKIVKKDWELGRCLRLIFITSKRNDG